MLTYGPQRVMLIWQILQLVRAACTQQMLDQHFEMRLVGQNDSKQVENSCNAGAACHQMSDMLV